MRVCSPFVLISHTLTPAYAENERERTTKRWIEWKTHSHRPSVGPSLIGIYRFFSYSFFFFLCVLNKYRLKYRVKMLIENTANQKKAWTKNITVKIFLSVLLTLELTDYQNEEKAASTNEKKEMFWARVKFIKNVTRAYVQATWV